eukprot:151317-Chlamydomonas_euryale.AAC.11
MAAPPGHTQCVVRATERWLALSYPSAHTWPWRRGMACHAAAWLPWMTQTSNAGKLLASSLPAGALPLRKAKLKLQGLPRPGSSACTIRHTWEQLTGSLAASGGLAGCLVCRQLHVPPSGSDGLLPLIPHRKDYKQRRRGRKGKGPEGSERATRAGTGYNETAAANKLGHANMRAIYKKTAALKLRLAAPVEGLLEMRLKSVVLDLLLSCQHLARHDAGAPQPAALQYEQVAGGIVKNGESNLNLCCAAAGHEGRIRPVCWPARVYVIWITGSCSASLPVQGAWRPSVRYSCGVRPADGHPEQERPPSLTVTPSTTKSDAQRELDLRPVTTPA